MTRRTKIVATIGPASDEIGSLRRLIEAGVDVVRLNLSHGSIEEHLERLTKVRAVAAELGRPVAVLADLPGPKIRAGHLPAGGVQLSAGAFVHLRAGDGLSDAGTLWVDYATLGDDLGVGDRVILGDGAISMRVTSTTAAPSRP